MQEGLFHIKKKMKISLALDITDRFTENKREYGRGN